MLLRHLLPSHHHDVVVHVDDPDATVADLAEALDPSRPAGPLIVDGRPVAAATPLDRAAIGDGATVRRPDPTGTVGDAYRAPAPPPLLVATVTTGFDTGRTFGLAAGTTRIGRPDDPRHAPAAPAPDPVDGRRLEVADATVSATHLRLDVQDDGAVVATDLASTNGTRLGDLPLDGPTPVPPGTELRCGACTIRLDRPPPPADPLPRLPAAGCPTRPLHRRLRRPPAEPGPPIEVPAPPEAVPAVTPIGVVAVLASTAVGGVMVLVLGSWTYAAFALLGPVLLVAGALDGRYRRRRTRRRGARRRRAELVRFEAELAERARAEVAARTARYPGAAAAVQLAVGADRSCWERRPGHGDAYAVRVGRGEAPWEPPVGDPDDGPDGDDVREVLARHALLPDAPIGLVLEPGRAVALVGPPPATRALARAMVVQAVTSHGPADLRVAVLAAEEHAPAWRWCAWLPHARVATSLVATDDGTATAVVGSLVDPPATGAAPARPAARTILLIDHPTGLAARRGPVRTALRAADDVDLGLVPIVLVAHERDVPASCEVVLTVGADGTLGGPASVVAGRAVVAGTALDVATDAARALARFDDPELTETGRGLPDVVGLGALLGPDRIGPAALAARWCAAGADPAPTAVLGTAADGPLVVDLAADGPHALVAGTTGSGKSELLRSFVASLAVSCSPDHLTFVLVDFKGGGAFDACARLPHTTGVVTDLDGHLAQRALRCLDAELRHRERRLRAVGADDLADLRRHHRAEPPLPRLVVVVDEFATLAAELPDFVASLVGVAQRGRSLGVHLVLATQRPSGSVSDHIRANAALRIALRVQDAADSTDVIDAPDAATLPRHRPGRALVRLGPGELVPVQAAFATGPVPAAGARIRVAPLGSVPSAEPGGGAATETAGRTDLAALVTAAGEAWQRLGGAPPRRPWPDPLPSEIAWPLPEPGPGADDEPDAGAPELALGLADHPDRQTWAPFTWRPADGPLLAVGLPGSGTTTVAATAVLAAAHRWAPDDLHVHLVDLGAGDLVPLAGLPHVGAVVGADDRERQRRLLAELADELATRRARPDAARVRRLLVIDGLAGFRARWDDVEPSSTWERLVDVATGGAAVGLHVLLTAEGPAATPHRLLTACAQRLVLRLGDAADHAAFGIAARAVPALTPGRGLLAPDATVVQVARPPDGLPAAVARLAGQHGPVTGRRPAPVGVLAEEEPLERLATEVAGGGVGVGGATGSGSDRHLLVGRADAGLGPAHLVLPSGGHALVAGPPRSGRTTALATIARSARAQGAAVLVVGRPDPAWPDDVVPIDPADGDLAEVIEAAGPALLVLVDDADRTADDHPALRAVVDDRRPGRHVVAAGRSDLLRTRYGHWTREVQADRCGLLLRPDLDLDGDLLGTVLPRRLLLPPATGRGWLVGGRPEGLVQVARGLDPRAPTHHRPAGGLPQQ